MAQIVSQVIIISKRLLEPKIQYCKTANNIVNWTITVLNEEQI